MEMFGQEIIIVHIVHVEMDQLYVQKKIVQFYNVNLYVNKYFLLFSSFEFMLI